MGCNQILSSLFLVFCVCVAKSLERRVWSGVLLGVTQPGVWKDSKCSTVHKAALLLQRLNTESTQIVALKIMLQL